MYVFAKSTSAKAVKDLCASGIDADRGKVLLVWSNTGKYTVFASGPDSFCGEVIELLGGAKVMVSHTAGMSGMPSAKMVYPEGVPLTAVRSDVDERVRKARRDLIERSRPVTQKRAVTLDSIMGE